MNTTIKNSTIACALVSLLLMAHQSNAATYRYRLSGNWTNVSDLVSPGWLNPTNTTLPGIGLPGAADDARINFANNTVTVDSAVPTVRRVQIGVDEKGILVVENGGVLTTVQDILAGNNNPAATGTLIVNDGGVANVGRILWAAQTGSTGFITINSGGTVNVVSHLWWGVTGPATIQINGTLEETAQKFGKGAEMSWKGSRAARPKGCQVT